MALSNELVAAIRILQNRGLPQEIKTKVKLHIADTIAISLAAHKGAPVVHQSISALKVGGASGNGRVISQPLTS